MESQQAVDSLSINLLTERMPLTKFSWMWICTRRQVCHCVCAAVITPAVEYECSFLKYHETEGGVVALFEGLAYPLRSRVRQLHLFDRHLFTSL